MKKIFKEPLIYFFILGLVVFGLHSFLNKDNGSQPGDPFTVEITSADIEWLRSAWASRTKRPPTSSELQGLIDAYIREEVLSREAFAMDLDDGDILIKKRLVQKMTYIFEGVAEAIEPTDDELKRYMLENDNKYRIPEMISFSQIYFNPNKRKDALKDSRETLARLQKTKLTPGEALSLGDIIMVDASFDQKSSDAVARVFGGGFSDELFSIEGQGWLGPIESSFGAHLVYINDRTDSRMPEFEEIRKDVEYDFMYEHKRKIVDNAYSAIKSRYTVLVEGLPYE